MSGALLDELDYAARCGSSLADRAAREIRRLKDAAKGLAPVKHQNTCPDCGQYQHERIWHECPEGDTDGN